MLKTIKWYEMNDGVDAKALLKHGFTVEENRYCYWCPLHESIELYIYFNINEDGTLSFDDYKDVNVIDDDYMQYYSPFYESKRSFYYLDLIIFKYNEVMDRLVNEGVLRPRLVINELEEQEVMKRVLK